MGTAPKWLNGYVNWIAELGERDFLSREFGEAFTRCRAARGDPVPGAGYSSMQPSPDGRAPDR
jgi:hypothetical protein